MTENVGGSHGYDFDLFVIGAGSGGVRASRMSASYGAKVAVVELAYNPISSDTLGGVGGTCVLRGCVPKKILVYGSSFSNEFVDSKRFGWDVNGEIKFDWKRLIANKTHEIERLNGIYKRMLANAKVTVLEGLGRLVDAHTVEVNEPNGNVVRYTSNHVLISTGGRAVHLEIPGKELGITSDEALSLEEFPQRVLVVGAGYIGVEFAGIFNGMGAEVDIFYRKPLPLSGFDKEFQALVANNLQARGVKLHPNSNILKLEKVEGGIKALSDDGNEYIADAVLFATGRKPNTKNLNLEAVGVHIDGQGAVKVNEYSQSSVPNIWAVGDVTNRIALTPVALMEGTALAKTLFAGQPTSPDYVNVPCAVFCSPPMSVVGLSEERAIEQANHDILVFTSSFNPMKNTISGRQEKTFMKLVVDSVTDQVLGVGMVGPDAPEIIQGFAVALKAGATKAQFDSTVGIHPSAAEEFVTMRTATRCVSPQGVVTKL